MQAPAQAKAFRILAILVLIVLILVYAKSFLIPLAFAGIIALLLLPVARWLEGKGLARWLSVLIALLLFLSLFAALIFFIQWQLGNLAQDTAKMEQQITQRVQDLKNYISDKMGIPKEKQEAMLKQQQESSSGKTGQMIAAVAGGIGGFLTNSILAMVYIFLMLLLRTHFKKAILRFVPHEKHSTAKDIMQQSQKVTQKYLGGLGLMIVCLWILYGIGFSITGVKNAIFFAVLCGVLEIIPFVGNLAGTLITLGMAMVQGGGSNMLIGILVTYALVQFIQSYIIEPLVVGSEVNINPFFTIAGIVAGESVWGIPGMILVLPLLGIAKIICDRVPALQPIGVLIGSEKKEKENGLKQKVKKLFGKR
jgi:predicted PurR-regulated permease PerM